MKAGILDVRPVRRERAHDRPLRRLVAELPARRSRTASTRPGWSSCRGGRRSSPWLSPAVILQERASTGSCYQAVAEGRRCRRRDEDGDPPSAGEMATVWRTRGCPSPRPTRRGQALRYADEPLYSSQGGHSMKIELQVGYGKQSAEIDVAPSSASAAPRARTRSATKSWEEIVSEALEQPDRHAAPARPRPRGQEGRGHHRRLGTPDAVAPGAAGRARGGRGGRRSARGRDRHDRVAASTRR